MEKLLDPKIDFIFKNIFGNKTSSNILISLLNAILGYKKEGKKITEITIDDSFIKKENIDDKFAILDIKATLNDGTRVNIEMQIVDQYDMKKRSLYYLSRLYSEQLKQGDEYRKLNGAIGINILNFNLLNNDRYHNHYLFKENETNEIYTDLMQIHIIELPKFNKNPNEIKDELESWVEFLKEPSTEVVNMLSKQVPEIIEAFEVLKVVSSNEETRRDAEIRIKAMSDKASSLAGAKEEGLQQGIEQGVQQGLYFVAENMLKNKIDLNIIRIATGLSIEEIEEIKKILN